MKANSIVLAFFALGLITLLWSCSANPASDQDPVAQLAALKEQRSALESQIATLEKDLEAQGLIERKLRTIAVKEVKTGPFSHYIDLQGKVEADESVAATSKIPGALKKVYTDNGDFVRKGQLLAEIDDAVILKNIAEVEGQLAVAEDLYNRQKSLWEQQIGSEVQFIQARNNKETLERSIATLKENWAMTKIYAPTSGTVDMVILKQGEAIAPGIPLCHILNLDNLLIKGEVTEAYAAVVKKGDVVQAHFPDMKKEITTRVSYVSKSINPVNRTFTVECQLGKGDYRANQIAVLRIVDYQNPKAVSIPVNLIQTDDQGDYVLIVENQGSSGQGVVKKIPVAQGHNYSGYVEISSGLQPGHLLITTGFQDVSAGETVLY